MKKEKEKKDKIIQLFQTPTSAKKGLWHILASETEIVANPLCNGFGYWFGGYYKDKPKMTKSAIKKCLFTGNENLCPACVEQAYIKKMITIEKSKKYEKSRKTNNKIS